MHPIKRISRLLAVSGLAIVFLATPAYAEESTAAQGGWGLLAGVGTLIYSPTKFVYATLGLVSSGLAWVFSGGDSEVATRVVHASVRGDWVLSPEHVRGERSLEFVGRAPAPSYDVAAEPPLEGETY